MAIFHLDCSHGSRKGGQSALAKLRYVLRRGKYARGRDDLEASGSGYLPEWCAGDPLPLFAAADSYERANARLYVELEGALPVELDLERCVELTRAMADEVAVAGLPFAWGIHAGRPPAPGQPRNRHYHLVFLERINDGIPRAPEHWFRRANLKHPASGGAAKQRSLKGHEWLPTTRRAWARLVNEALGRTGCPERVTAASHRDRIAHAEAVGDQETAEYLRRHPPGRHIGPTACAIERGRPGRPGRRTERGDLARARESEAARLRAGLETLERECDDLTRAAVAAALDAGVEVALVDAARPDNPDTVIALDAATEKRRGEIRTEARAAGLDDDESDRIRREAEPDRADLGWAAVAAATAVMRERSEAIAHRERQEQQAARARLKRRETAIRATSRGTEWMEAERRRILAGGRQRLTFAERKSIIERVEKRLDEQQDRLEQKIATTDDGAALLREAKRARGENAPPPTSAERERILAGVSQQLREAREAEERRLEEGAKAEARRRSERRRSVERDPFGRELLRCELDDLAPGWREGKHVPGAVMDAALDRVEARLEAARRERDLNARLTKSRDELGAETVDWLLGMKLDDLAPGHADGPPSLECREEALDWADAKATRLLVLRSDQKDLFDGRIVELRRGGKNRPEHIDEAIQYARSQYPVQVADIQQRLTEIRDMPAAGSAEEDLYEAGFGTSHRSSLQALDRVEAQLRQRFDDGEATILRDPDGEGSLRGARVQVLGEDRPTTTLPERARVIEAAQVRLEAVRERKEAAANLARLFATPGGDERAFEALDIRVPGWRTTDVGRSELYGAIETAAWDAGDREGPARERHRFVVAAERAFPDAGSHDWRAAGHAFDHPGGDKQVRSALGRLSDRERLREAVEGRKPAEASPNLVQRIVAWLRRQVEYLLRMVRPAGTAHPDAGREITPGSTTARRTPEVARTDPPGPETSAAPFREGEDQRDDGKHGATEARARDDGEPSAGDVEPRGAAKSAATDPRGPEIRPELEPTAEQQQEEGNGAFAQTRATTQVAPLRQRGGDPVDTWQGRCTELSDRSIAAVRTQLSPAARDAFDEALKQDDAGDAERRAAAELRRHGDAIDQEHQRRRDEWKKKGKARGWLSGLWNGPAPEPSREETATFVIDQDNEKVVAEIEEAVRAARGPGEQGHGEDSGVEPPAPRPSEPGRATATPGDSRLDR